MQASARALAALVCLSPAPAFAVIGGSPVGAGDPAAAETVMITGNQGFCTGAVIGERLVLTAAIASTVPAASPCWSSARGASR